jgi:hypothetical protein
MTQKRGSDSIFTPELVKIIKIFGLISIGLVVALSFFNTKRASNTEANPIFRMPASNRLYFLNIRAIDYDVEIRTDAKMSLYRHDSRATWDEVPTIDFVIILNKGKDEAYLYLEPKNTDWPIRLKVEEGNSEQTFEFQNGNKSTFYEYSEDLQPWLLGHSKFQLKTKNGWVKIWDIPSEKQAIKTTLEDFYQLINQD